MPVFATCPKCGLELQLGPISDISSGNRRKISKISDLPPGYKARCLECGEIEMKMEERGTSCA